MPNHRFPPPWTVEDIGAAFVVKDSAGQKLAYVYFEDEPGGFSTLAPSRRRFATIAMALSLKSKAAVGSLQRPPSTVVH
jgi:hypothetical protein